MLTWHPRAFATAPSAAGLHAPSTARAPPELPSPQIGLPYDDAHDGAHALCPLVHTDDAHDGAHALCPLVHRRPFPPRRGCANRRFDEDIQGMALGHGRAHLMRVLCRSATPGGQVPEPLHGW
jgi:hypothetical protein